MIEQTYRIDMIPDGAPVVVHVSQYDTAARRLSFELYNGGVAYELPAGAVASIAGTKPDNTSFLYAMTVSGNLVSIDLQQQMALVAGDVPAEIQITGAEGKIGSANFIIRVERGPIDENSVISETDLPIFEQLVSDAQEAASDAQEAASDAQTAANTASVAASSVSAILPASPGSAGQVLTKTANAADWADKYPSGGTAGQVLTKTANGEAWEDVDGLPAGGTTGQVLTKNSSTSGDASWQDVDGLPSGGTTGQVLTKNSSTDGDASWQTLTSCPFPIGFGGFFQSDPNSIYAGTTWEQKKDVFILAAGDTYPAGSTGGEAQHKLEVSELPKNIGQLNALSWASHAADTNGAFSIKQNHQDKALSDGNVVGDATYYLSGGGNAHNNMPPYFAMPFWVRTA